MITKVRLDYFKRFSEETFDLDDTIVLAGPNNSGKTTLLQAIASWGLCVKRWLSEHAESSEAEQRTGVPITRKDFTAVPLREMRLLWHNARHAYSREEKPGVKAGQPRLAEITVWGTNGGGARTGVLGYRFATEVRSSSTRSSSMSTAGQQLIQLQQHGT